MFDSPVTRSKDDTAILANTIVCNECQVAEGFLAVLDALHPRGDINDTEVEVNLVLVSATTHRVTPE
jgi:hypothetical protein